MSWFANDDEEYDGLHEMMFGTDGLKREEKEEKMNNKQTVYYHEQLMPVVVGQSALVGVVSHPKLGRAGLGEYARTSTVVAVGEDGTTFETQNSIYVYRDVPLDVV